MTNGQIAKLQELDKCFMTWPDKPILTGISFDKDEPMNKWEERQLRRLWHQYRHQIAAMKRNRK